MDITWWPGYMMRMLINLLNRFRKTRGIADGEHLWWTALVVGSNPNTLRIMIQPSTTNTNILRAVCYQSLTIQQRTFSEECANSQWQYSREHSQRRVLTVSDNTAENILRAVFQQSVTIPQSSFDQYQQWISVRFLSWKPVTVNSAPDTLY